MSVDAQELFLEYPDVEKILKEAPSFSTAIVRYIGAVKNLKETVLENSKWKTNKEKDEAKRTC